MIFYDRFCFSFSNLLRHCLPGFLKNNDSNKAVISKLQSSAKRKEITGIFFWRKLQFLKVSRSYECLIFPGATMIRIKSRQKIKMRSKAPRRLHAHFRAKYPWRKLVLLLNHIKCRLSEWFGPNLHYVYLSKNSTAIKQPLDCSAFAVFKNKYGRWLTSRERQVELLT